MSFFELCVAGVGVCAQAAERRAHSRSSKKSKKKNPDGWSGDVDGGNADLPQFSLKARAPRNSLIINAEVISHTTSHKPDQRNDFLP